VSTVSQSSPPALRKRTASGSILVATGIFLSRIAGLVRDRIFAHYFGNSFYADAYRAAARIPNYLQNLFGEGVLSASFIPVYSRLIAEGKEEEAGRVAGAIGAILALLTSILVLIGVFAAPFMTTLFAAGFTGEKRALTIQLVRILFPGVGMLVLSAWTLGILNSHRKFLLSYAAPVVWNATIILSMLAFADHRKLSSFAVIVTWGNVVGCLLQFLVQLPTVLKLVPHLRVALHWETDSVQRVLKSFPPIFTARGVVQISAWIDSQLASFLPTGAISTLTYAQTIYMLPISLFGMAISAAELPAMSSSLGSTEEIYAALRKRLAAGLGQIAFFVVPSAIGFFVLGDVVVAAIYQSGRFHRADTIFVWGVLAGSSVGLLAGTLGRLFSSAYYSTRDTRTPLRFAIVRVALTLGLGILFAFPLPRWIGIDPKWGVAGLTASAGIAAWVEFLLLRRSLEHRIGKIDFPRELVSKLWVAAATAAGIAFLAKHSIPYLVRDQHPVISAVVILAPYGLLYVLLAKLMKVPQADALLARIRRK
jgi:putative peptidoglycan lipid II flippase